MIIGKMKRLFLIISCLLIITSFSFSSVQIYYAANADGILRGCG